MKDFQLDLQCKIATYNKRVQKVYSNHLFMKLIQFSIRVTGVVLHQFLLSINFNAMKFPQEKGSLLSQKRVRN